jgi:hypothetical protein
MTQSNMRHATRVPWFVVNVLLLQLLILALGYCIPANANTNRNHHHHHYDPHPNYYYHHHPNESIMHRIFPAAQVEMYTPESTVLGMVLADQLSIQTIGPVSVSTVLDSAVERFRRGLFGGAHYLPDYPEDYPENPQQLSLVPMDKIEIHVLSYDTKLADGTDESYTISIDDSDDGGGRGESRRRPRRTSSGPDKKRPSSSLSSSSSSVTTIVQSNTVFGAVRALETLAQLMEFGWILSTGSSGGGGDGGNEQQEPQSKPVFVLSDLPIYIADSPSFAYRGLMIDTSRHYLPMNLILHNLDAMAMNKLNVLHWHLTDRESFPYQSASYPELAQQGAYSPRRIYTTDDIQRVVHEAYLRGIRVIPEIDMPGHTNGIAKSHPELMAHCPLASEPLDPTNPNVYDFVETIYHDLAAIFPDAYVHVGGDEVNFQCWTDTPTIQSWMKQHNMTTSVELYEYFETKLLHIVNDKLNKTPIVWQEVFNLNLTLSDKAIVDVWKGFDRETAAQATLQNHRVILSGCWYLDYLHETWQTFYQCNPRDFNGTVDLMIGGHASMWGEHVDASNFISRVWPRASAMAERLWTGDVEGVGANVTIASRIHNFRCRMVQQGFAAEPTGPGVCPFEVPYLVAVEVETGYP